MSLPRCKIAKRGETESLKKVKLGKIENVAVSQSSWKVQM
jgi:hypothetical protein